MKKILNLLGYNNTDIKIIKLFIKYKKLTFIEIEKDLNIRQPQVSLSIKKLYDKKLIVKQYQKNDNNRNQAVMLFTPNGYKKMCKEIVKYAEVIVFSRDHFLSYGWKHDFKHYL